MPSLRLHESSYRALGERQMSCSMRECEQTAAYLCYPVDVFRIHSKRSSTRQRSLLRLARPTILVELEKSASV